MEPLHAIANGTVPWLRTLLWPGMVGHLTAGNAGDAADIAEVLAVLQDVVQAYSPHLIHLIRGGASTASYQPSLPTDTAAAPGAPGAPFGDSATMVVPAEGNACETIVIRKCLPLLADRSPFQFLGCVYLCCR